MSGSSKSIDWEAVEVQYRAGLRSLKDIGAEFGVSDAAIIKRAKRDEWVRNLKAKIQAKADAKVSAAMVSAEVSKLTKQREKEVIEVESQAQARVRLEHRKDIQRYRNLVAGMLKELEAETGDPALFAQIGEILAGGEEAAPDKLQEAYRRAISLPQRIDGVKKLADTLKILIGLERQAYGISDNADGDRPADSAAETVAKVLDFVSIRERAQRGASQ